MKKSNSICAICKVSTKHTLLYKKNFSLKKHLNTHIFSARRLPDKIHGTIVRCNSCGLVRSIEVIDRSRLNELYKDSRFTYSSMTEKLKDTYTLILKTAMKFVPSKGAFMEVGCGNGFMLESAKSHGFKQVFGVEPSIDAISHADKSVKKHIVNDILKTDTFPGSKFDLVCAFQVFDHIPDPNSFLKICHKILKDKGVLLLMNHDVSSLSAKALGERSPIFDIEHTYLYDQSTISQILTQNHFRVKKVYSPQAIMTIRYISRLLPLPNKIKEILSNMSFPLLDKTITFHPGNLSVIAIKQ